MIPSLDNIVSCETIEKINIYKNLLSDWNRRTALVQEDTLREFETRHVLDSLQIIPIIHEMSKVIGLKGISDGINGSDKYELYESPFMGFIGNGFRLDQPSEYIRDLSIIDVGTGAGFPGMILSLCGFSSVTLCESNTKKCIFLEELARQMGIHVNIRNERVENVSDKFDIVVSRACTNLEKLLKIMNTIASSIYTYGIFHKGRSWQVEVSEAQQDWVFRAQVYNSMTSPDGVLVGCLYLNKR